jgi:hypothetical protein
MLNVGITGFTGSTPNYLQFAGAVVGAIGQLNPKYADICSAFGAFLSIVDNKQQAKKAEVELNKAKEDAKEVDNTFEQIKGGMDKHGTGYGGYNKPDNAGELSDENNPIKTASVEYAFSAELDFTLVLCATSPRYELYDREAAVEYALTYSNNDGTTRTTPFNKSFNLHYWPNSKAERATNGTDCTNFVSQCIWYAGVGMTDDWYFTGKVDPFGRVKASKTWYESQSFANWLRNDSGWLNAEITNKNHWNASEICQLTKTGAVQVGDLIGIRGKKDNVIKHWAIITKIDSDGMVYYSAHSVNRQNRPLAEVLDSEYVNFFALKDRRRTTNENNYI